MSSSGRSTAIWRRSAEGGGWSATIHPVEVGCRGFVGGVCDPAPPCCGNDRKQPEKSHKGVGGGGRKSKFLDVVAEEGQYLGLNTPLRSVAGSGVGRRPHSATAPPPGGVLALGAKHQ